MCKQTGVHIQNFGALQDRLMYELAGIAFFFLEKKSADVGCGSREFNCNFIIHWASAVYVTMIN